MPLPAGPGGAQPQDFREAAAKFASGVTVVTTRQGDHVFGKTVSSFASLSLDPVLVTVSVRTAGPLVDLVRQSGCFGISVLARGQEAVSQYFAAQVHEPVRGAFPGMTTVSEVTGSPIIAGCLSFFDCQMHDMLPGGDHVILVGRVVATGGGEGEPLLYWSGSYRALNPSHDSTRGADRGRVVQQIGDVFALQLSMLDVPSDELVDGQAAIEPAVAALAAQRADDNARSRLMEAVERNEQCTGDRFAYHRSSNAFHSLLAEASGNRLLQLALLALRRVQEVYYLGIAEEDAVLFAAQHRLIGEAVVRGDATAAEAEMTAHMRDIRDRVVGDAGT